MAAQNQGVASNVDLFDAYFKRADLDRDGRISGSEAVAFFQGSNLPKHVLAQIWTYADQNRTGFLGRTEFYNSLKLVTVAQSKRELTPDIVRAAFYGPASAKIPPPQINLPATPGPQPNPVITPQVGAVPGSPQNPAFRTASPQSTNMNQQFNLSHNNQSVRPAQPVPGGAVRPVPSVASQGFSGVGPAHGTALSNSAIQSNGGGGKTNGVPTSMPSQANLPATQAGSGPGALGSTGSALQLPASAGMMPSSSTAKSPLRQNGFASGSLFGEDGFSATEPQKKFGQGTTSSTSNVPVLSGLAPVSAAALSYTKPGSLETTQISPTLQSGGRQLQKMQSLPQQPQQITGPNVSSAPVVSSQVVAVQPQQQWPRLTESDRRKYTETFLKVDKDKDGKITGEEARNLFLSWGLPKDVLKQVWDLSDQDNDSMLSLREFCIALYLMERHREKRSLPTVLPSHIMYDLPPAVQTSGGFGHTAQGYYHGPQQPVRPGFGPRPPTHPPPGGPQQPAMPGFGPRPPTRPPSGKPPLPAIHADNRAQPKEQMAKVPVLEKHLVDQLSEGEQKSLNSKFQEATEANKKVEELEKDIKESREKMEFYRIKMQELVLYKSRCDTRLNEMTSRVSADKHEVELLAKKYEEKYRQTGDVASRLTIEEATFRDIQERKMEMYKAIVKLEQDGSTDETLKARVEQIQSSLEELVKSLNGRCKTYGLRAKPTTLVELPFGWQLGIQLGAADWDEDWDNFEDEGFTPVKELTLDVKNLIAPPKMKSKPRNTEKSVIEEGGKATASADAEAKMEKTSVFREADDSETRKENTGNMAQVVTESHHEQASAFKVRSTAAKSSSESLHKEFEDGHSEKAAPSPRAKTMTSEQRGAESSFSGKSIDETGLGAFDQNDNAELTWGVNRVSISKGMEDDDLFGPGSLSLNPIKTGSKFGESGFLKKGSSIFADSAPGTPFSSSFSPQRYNEGPREHLPNFSRFDSFRSTDGGFQPQEKQLSRFDSMRSTDYEFGKGFPAFDDSDPFSSGGPFRLSLGGETPRTEVDAFGTGPFQSSLGTETPRTEVDPFGAGPFRSTFGSETPRGSDPFGSGPFKSSFGGETPRESDPFGSGLFKSSFGTETPRGGSDSFGSFGPFNSSFGAETPRRDSDPFGSVGPFNSSFGAETPRRDSDPFGSVGPFRASLGNETPRSDWMDSETPKRGDFDSFGYSGPFKSSFGSETPRSEVDPFGSSGPFRSTLGDETPRSESDPFGYTGSFTSETPRGTTTSNWSAF